MPWSDNPNAPRIQLSAYRGEKAVFAGIFIGAMFYGIVIILFFQCMGALLNPVNRPWRTIKWPLVVHTVAMFSIVTVATAIYLNIQSVAYIDYRKSPHHDDPLLPGPLIYQDFLYSYSKANSVALVIMVFLNAWLADGLLLCRCYVIYSMNYWVIAFPCLMYLASFVVGIAFIYQTSRPIGILRFLASVIEYEVPYYSISFALNLLLTLMIITRLFMLHRNIRNAVDIPIKVNGLYKVIVTSLIESCALSSVVFVLFVGPWAAGSPILGVFLPILPEVQVIAPFLITLQIANQNSSTNITGASGNISSIHFVSRGGWTGGEGDVVPDGCPAGAMDVFGGFLAEPGVAVEITTDPQHED